jgi:hypothetical protein
MESCRLRSSVTNEKAVDKPDIVSFHQCGKWCIRETNAKGVQVEFFYVDCTRIVVVVE